MWKMAESKQRAFTLVEAMAVVVVVGILATIAVTGFRKYVTSAKTSEAVQMLGAIKSAQEAFRAETFRYLDVSGSLENVYPQGELDNLGSTKFSWEGGPEDIAKRFRTLGVTSPNPVMYGYSTVAGPASQNMPALTPEVEGAPAWPDPPGGAWYVAEAIGDLDGDKVYSVYATSNLTAAIASFRESE
jgi:type IV pilus assembly protein PilA